MLDGKNWFEEKVTVFEPIKALILKEEIKQNKKFVNVNVGEKGNFLKRVATIIETKNYLKELKINYEEVPM